MRVASGVVPLIAAAICTAAALTGCAGDSGGSSATTCREFLAMDVAAQIASVDKMLQDRGADASRDAVVAKQTATVSNCQPEDKKKSTIGDVDH